MGHMVCIENQYVFCYKMHRLLIKLFDFDLIWLRTKSKLEEELWLALKFIKVITKI
jgi:hypothetical protein